MVTIHKKKGDPNDIVFRKFGRIMYEENLVDELRDRKTYKKPSIVRKEEAKERRKNKGRKPKTNTRRMTFHS